MSAAQTRFNNDQLKAAQLSLVGNLSAQRAFKSEPGRRKRPMGGGVGLGTNTSPAPLPQPAQFNPIADRDVSQIVPEHAGTFRPMYPPQAAPQGSIAPPQESDPALDGLLRAVHVEKLVGSPETAAAYTKVRLRDHFHGHVTPNPGKEVFEILRSTMKE